MKRYVVAFAFNELLTRVVLIRKNRPEWQAGKLNGVGGKIGHLEQDVDAMIREFKEEAGVETSRGDWLLVSKIFYSEAQVVIYTSCNQRIFDEATTMTDEAIMKVSAAKPSGWLPTVKELINLSMERISDCTTPKG